MALQIWLPLNKNGDLSNKGLANVTVTNNGATYNASGKIGGCWNIPSSANSISLVNCMNVLKTYNNYSMCAWVYITNEPTGHSAAILSSGNWNHTNNGNLCFGFYNYSSGFNKLLIPNKGSWLNGINLSNKIVLNTWYHVAISYDGSKTIGYVNGEYVGESSLGGICENSDNNNLKVGGATYTTSFGLRGSINDVRIYDHCLSPKEIKELSKGLVLHYPLNNTQVLNNCFENPTFNTSASSGGWHHWGPSGYSATYSLNTDKQFIYNKTQTYSHKVSNTGSTYYVCYQSPAFDGGYRSAQAIIKMSDGSNPTGKVVFGHNANVGTNTPNTFHHLGDGFYLMRHEGFRQDGSDNLVSISVLAGYTVYISEAYLENNRTVCSDLFQGNIVYDLSGYNNNGTIYGSCINVLDSPRYDKCTLGNADIRASNIILNNPFTISYWVYLPATGDAGSGNEIEIGPFNLYKDHDGVDKHTFSVSKSDNSTVYLTLGVNMIAKWYHVVIVSNGNEVKIYKDGVVSTHSISTKNGLTTFNLLLNNNLKLSDVRIYVTALSADDIKALYQEAAFIDHKGNVGCYLFYEDNIVDSQITKTGLIKSSVVQELPRKNLFDKNTFQLNKCNYNYTPTNPYNYRTLSGKCAGTAIIKPNTQYVLTCDTSIATTFNTVYLGIDGSVIASYINSGDSGLLISGTVRTSPNDAYFVTVSNFGSLSDANQLALINSLQLEEASASSTYVAYDSQHDAEVGQNKIIGNQLIEI